MLLRMNDEDIGYLLKLLDRDLQQCLDNAEHRTEMTGMVTWERRAARDERLIELLNR